MEILVPISLGELYDKISILLIKKEKIKDAVKLENVQKELDILQEIAEKYDIDGEFHTQLHDINEKIWGVEDEIRKCEKEHNYGKHFISCARLIYHYNDTRSYIKKNINLKYRSTIIEEKSYE